VHRIGPIWNAFDDGVAAIPFWAFSVGGGLYGDFIIVDKTASYCFYLMRDHLQRIA
jgi:hypothetical protein